MICNVFNTYDLQLMSDFLVNFTAPGFRYSETNSPEVETKTAFSSTYVTEISKVMQLCVIQVFMFPDMIFQVPSVQVCKRSDQFGSKVVMKTVMQGTLLYLPQTSMDKIDVDNEGNLKENQFQIQSNPKEISLEGICVLHLDENHRIRIFEIVTDTYRELNTSSAG